jgi:hypothetical protein
MAHVQNIAEWRGKDLVDRDGEKIGKLEDVYVDVETDEPMFGTVKEGLFARHLTFVPLRGITIGPDNLQATVSKDQVQDAPTSRCTATNSPRRESQPSITTTSSTTRRPRRRAVAGSPAADTNAAACLNAGVSGPSEDESEKVARGGRLAAMTAQRCVVIGPVCGPCGSMVGARGFCGLVLLARPR